MLLSGWFQDLPGQKECIPCPAGFHCQPLNPGPTRGTSLGVSSPLPCPAGHICPRDSLDNQPVPCPKGTYSSSQGLISTGGNRIFLYYVLLITSSKLQLAHLKTFLTACPHFMLMNCMRQIACFAVWQLMSQLPVSLFAGQCLMCPAGHFCGSEGLVEPSGSCAAGFLCLMGAKVPNPKDNMTGSLCPPGIFCQQGLRAGRWNLIGINRK